MEQEFISRPGNKRYIFGINAVREACNNRRIIELIVNRDRLRDPSIKKIMAACESLNVKSSLTDKITMDILSENQKNQGIAAEALAPPTLSLEQLINSHERGNFIYLLLDGITDPQNFGAILRTAESAGVRAVILEKHRIAPFNNITVQSSAGASEIIPTVKVSNLKHAILALKEIGVWVYATDIESKTTLWEVDFNDSSAIILGSEGEGIRPSLKKYCDQTISIPMFGDIQSLNVSASTAVLLYEILRQNRNEHK